MTLFLDSRTFRVLLTGLLFAVVLAFIYLARHTLLLFIFAILFAYLLEPIVPNLQRVLHIGRGKAIAVLYLLLLGLLVILAMSVGPKLVHQSAKLARTLPSLSQEVASGNIAHQIGQQHGWSWATQTEIKNFIQTHQQLLVKLEDQIASDLALIASHLWWFVLVPILAVFFLKDGSSLSASLTELVIRRQQRRFLEQLLSDWHHILAHYIRAQLLLTAIALVVYMLGFWLLGMPYAGALGTTAGLLEFVPLVGPLTAAALVIVISMLAGFGKIIALLIFLGVFRMVQDYFNSPRIMGRQVELHPLAVLFGVLVGAEIGGVIGVYLSIPIMASLRVLWQRWRSYDAAKGVITSLPAAEVGESH